MHAPNVSALGNFLIKAFFLAILWTPIANDIVTTAGSPSGIAATANAIAAINISRAGFFEINVPYTNIVAAINITAIAKKPLKCFSFFCKGRLVESALVAL